MCSLQLGGMGSGSGCTIQTLAAALRALLHWQLHVWMWTSGASCMACRCLFPQSSAKPGDALLFC